MNFILFCRHFGTCSLPGIYIILLLLFVQSLDTCFIHNLRVLGVTKQLFSISSRVGYMEERYVVLSIEDYAVGHCGQLLLFINTSKYKLLLLVLVHVDFFGGLSMSVLSLRVTLRLRVQYYSVELC
eukprot:Rmarinus@m.4669